MIDIQSVLSACKGISPKDTLQAANLKIAPTCFEYCKNHVLNSEIILIISVKGFKPLLYSWSYNFSITNLHDKVKSSLDSARRHLNADIVVLVWFPKKGTKLPYYVQKVA